MNFVRARRTAGLGLMLSSLVVGLFAAPAATAAEAEVPEGREGADIIRQAYWNADQAKYADNAATREWPPQAVCLVQPQACFFSEKDHEKDPTGQSGEIGAELNEGSSQVGSAERELLTAIAEADDGTEPTDPVPPESHPVSVAFGQQNYRSAIEFELPDLPDGEQVDQFFVVLTEGDPTYSNESPAFRQAVLAALTCAQTNEEPQGRCTQSEFEKIPNSELRGDSPLSVEACPITGDWEAGGSQDEDTLPEVNCLYTAGGVPVEGPDGEILWVFDMFFAARAWYDGTLEYRGVLFRPGSAENFAYGDPETTYSKQVTFEKPVQVAMTSSPEPPPPPAPPAPPPPSSGFSTGGSGSSDVFGTPQQGSFSPPSGGSATTEQPPTVSQPETTAEPAPAQAEQPATLAAGTPLGEPETPGWIWSLVPMFLGGAWLLSRALAEEAVLGTSRSGAMTRLLERQAVDRTPDLVTG